MTESLTIVLISGAVGGSVAALLNLLSNWLARRSEERRHLRNLIINTAVETWKKYCDTCIASGQKGVLLPVEVFILQMNKFASSITTEKIDASNVKRLIGEIEEFEREIRKSFMEGRARTIEEMQR